MRKLFFFRSSSHDSSVPNGKMQKPPVGNGGARDGLNGRKENQSGESSVFNQKNRTSSPHDDQSTSGLNPGRQPKIKKSERWHRQPNGSGRVNPENPSSRSCAESCVSSPCSSPMPLRCRSARFAQASSGTLDLYIDGEQNDRDEKSEQDLSGYSWNSGEDGLLTENMPLKNRERSTLHQASSGMRSPGNALCRSQSFRLIRDSGSMVSSGERLTSPLSDHILEQDVRERLTIPLPRKCKLKLRELGSETSTVADYVEDYMQKCIALEADTFMPGHDQRPHGTHIKSTLTSGFLGVKQTSSIYQEQKEETDENSLKTFYNKDEKLLEECKAAEQRFSRISDESEMHSQWKNWRSDELIHLLCNLNNDRRKLAAEVVEQLQRRMTERSYMKNTFEMEKIEHDALTRKIEKEKNEIQLCLERELDRRSNDWSSKHEKFKAEEKRLRERVRDLAEKNVSLHREVVSLNSKETENQARLGSSEQKMNELLKKLEKANLENSSLHQSLASIEERCEATESDRDFMRKCYKEKEDESKDFRKMVVSLQKTCNDLEKTINGLRLNLTVKLEKDSVARTDLIHELQMEQMRLTGVEQTLRKDIDSSIFELETLRRENISLLERMQSGEPAFLKLDEELHTRIERLQEHGVLLLDQHSTICTMLLDKLKLCKDFPRGQLEITGNVSELSGYSLIETEMKVQNLKRESERFKMSLGKTIGYFHEKLNLASHSQCQLLHADGNESERLKPRVHGQFELEAEVLLTKVLRERLWSKEIELENLQTQFASSLRLNDVLKAEMERTQDSISCLTHKLQGLELEIVKKNASIETLDMNLQKCQKELTLLKGTLTRISGERDVMWDQVKECNEKNMLQNYELDALRKKLEELDEEILIKEGQITILKDSLNDRPDEMLHSPKPCHDSSLSQVLTL